MPLEAELFLDTTAGPEEIKAHLLRTMPFEDEPDFLEFKCLHSEATYVQIDGESHPDTLEVFRDQFGIGVKLRILFQHRNRGDPDSIEEWDIQTTQATLSLLKRFAGDAALISYNDTPVLLRKDGALKLLYADGGMWDAREPANRLSLVDLPYTVEPADHYL